jgi:hypothetical protein
VRAGVAAHPVTLGALVTFVAAAYPVAVWVEGHFMTRAEANRKAAWLSVQVAELQETVMQNRVNECDSKEKAGTITVFESSVCKDYRIKLGAASTARERRRTDAEESSK